MLKCTFKKGGEGRARIEYWFKVAEDKSPVADYCEHGNELCGAKTFVTG
jgi:hypothetical protein